jgi:hypothetical protein
MGRIKILWLTLAVVVLVWVTGVFNGPESEEPEKSTQVALDYSKPIFTTYRTAVCPTSLFLDMRADHAPDKVIEMFYSFWDRSGKAEKLGCAELRPDLLVKAAPFFKGTATVEMPGSPSGSLFTVEDELTNKIPGQSDAARSDLASPHINKTPDGPLPPASNDIGRLLVTIPDAWHRDGEPILKGNVMAHSDSSGTGAIICPDSDTMALAFSTPIPHGDSGARIRYEELETWLKSYGCSYLPPGTPMVSEGGNAANTLAIVTTELADGTKLSGVTFPNMIVQMVERDLK